MLKTKIFQFKVTLKASKPQVYRTFLVEENITFHQFHEIIQKVMGWYNEHLYEFSLSSNCKITGDPDGGNHGDG